MASEHVLILDDDRYFLNQLAQKLDDRGIRVMKAVEVTEALGLLDSATYQVDLVVTDVALPSSGIFNDVEVYGGYRTGLAFARLLKRRFPGIRVLSVSGTDDSEVVAWFETFAAGFIRKGETVDSIANQIARMIKPQSTLLC